ncbi:hypothetical protein [Embleya sp. NPDC050493]|uniref:hypothetical protein n=1 Tax=Embleya sp. NPDC050493 TaxID=3363989 RepID=UPI0037A5D01C
MRTVLGGKPTRIVRTANNRRRPGEFADRPTFGGSAGEPTTVPIAAAGGMPIVVWESRAADPANLPGPREMRWTTGRSSPMIR